MLRLISPWSMQELTNVPVSCPDPNPSVSPCQMAKLRHARLRLRQKNRLTSPASPKNIMTLPMFSAKLKPTNYHLTDLTISRLILRKDPPLLSAGSIHYRKPSWRHY